MPEKLPVVAAVPNYNMGQQLAGLLPELARQDYSDIFVLDDASTDGSREIVEDLNKGGGIQFVASAENKGSGATRNLIMKSLGYQAIIHFLDADVRLRTDNVARVAQDIMPSSPIGFIGGLVLTPDGIQNVWNYGPRQSLKSDVGANIQSILAPMVTSNPKRAKAIRNRFSKLLADWPDPLSEPVRRPVFWNIEANLLISCEVFSKIGGFDEKLREHEIQDLAIRLNHKGLSGYFDPSISVVQNNSQNVREYNRALAMIKAEWYINRKHGLKNWLFPKNRN